MFTPARMRDAIADSKNSTAQSTDDLTIHQLKNLGPLVIEYLTKLFNLSFQRARLLAIWKYAIILPQLKPGNPKTQGTSYRPIPLLRPASKVLEKLMLQRIKPHLNLVETQQGFRAGRYTTTALLPLVQHAAVDSNQRCSPKRTVIKAMDF